MSQPPKIPSLPIHAIVWEDAAYADTERPTTVTACTLGVILENNDKHVIVVGEAFSDSTSRHYTAIPKRMVQRIVRVGRVKLPEFEQPALPVENEEDDVSEPV